MAELINISGIFTNPDGSPASGVELVISALTTSSATFRQRSITVVTDEDGAYSFSLVPGTYRVTAQYPDENRTSVFGDLLIEAGCPDGTLNDYLQYADPQLTNPTVYADIERMHRQATGAASDTAAALESSESAVVAAAAAAETAKEHAQTAENSITIVTEQAAAAAATIVQTEENAATAAAAEAAATAAAEAAATAAAAAESATENDNTFSDVESALNATEPGEFFRVPGGSGSNVAFTYYLNDAGTAVAVSETVGLAAITKAVADAAALNERTGGLQTQAASQHPFEIVDSEGKAALWLTEKGQLNAPGGLSVAEFESTTVSTETVNATTIIGETLETDAVTTARVDVGSDALAEQINAKYLFSIEDSAGKVAFAMLADGSLETLGFPLIVRPGLPGNDFFFIGDSITAFTQTTSGSYNDTNRDEAPCVCAQGWPVWAQFFSNGRVRFAGISATGGYRTDQILETHVPVAVAAAPTFCVVLAGRNNIVQSIDYEKSVSDLTKIYKTLRQAGIIPVCCAMSAQTGNSDAKNILRYKINAFIRAYAQFHALPFVDFHAATTDPATGEWFDDWNYDASHPTATGAIAMGQCLVDAITPWTPPIFPPIPASQTTPETSRNLIPNPLFLENNGTDPDGWSVVTQSTALITTHDDVKGAVWQLSGSTQARRYLTMAVTPGERLGFGFVWRSDTDSANHIYIVAGDDQTGKTYLAGIRRWAKASDGFGTFYKEFIVPDDTENITIVISASGLSIGQIGLTQITEI